MIMRVRSRARKLGHNDGHWVQYSHVFSRHFINWEKDFSNIASKTVSPVVSRGGNVELS